MTDLRTILEQIAQPSSSLNELPHRIELCRLALGMVDPNEDPVLWGGIHFELAGSLLEIPNDKRAENIEHSIAHFLESHRVYSLLLPPEFSAITESNLGEAYRNRIYGDIAENFEIAINYLKNALDVLTQQEFPDQWATAHSNLGKSYSFRIRGEKRKNIEQAITHFLQALKVHTHQTFPEQWAIIQNNLGNAYADRISGKRAENLEQSIDYFHQALSEITNQSYPELWATTQNNLGTVYTHRINGDQAENIECAISCFHQALQVYDRQEYPEDWAMTLSNLATTYSDSLYGDPAENIERAIEYFHKALQIYKKDSFPQDWAMANVNLAVTFKDRIHGNKAENIELAIEYLQQALQVYTREELPFYWANIQNNLGATYSDRVYGDRAENIEKVITYYQLALQIYTYESFPTEWARAQKNLGLTYSQRVHGDRAENIRQATWHLQQALKERTLKQLPSGYQQTQLAFGQFYFDEGNWSGTVDAHKAVIEAEQLLLESAYTEMGRRAETALTSKIYAKLSYALLKLGRFEEALLQLEQGKTRVLAKALALSEVDLSLLPSKKQDIILHLRKSIWELEGEMRQEFHPLSRETQRTLAAELEKKRKELNAEIKSIRIEFPQFMSSIVELTQILSLIPPTGALVAPVITSQGSAIFIVPSNLRMITSAQILWLDDFTSEDLHNLILGNAGEHDQRGWLEAHVNQREYLEDWYNTIDWVGEVLWGRLVSFIHQHLATLGIKHVLLLPQGELGLLPLHAAYYKVKGKKHYFFDDYTISYTPSAYALKVSQDRLKEKSRNKRTLFATLNPTKDLPFTISEGEKITSLFGSNNVNVLKEENATSKAVHETAGNFSYLHFSCHGSYNLADTMQSGLVMAGKEILTLGEIISNMNLESSRLVTLSACDTGIIDIRLSPDEFLGLPAGFLQAGVPAVISTLWAVNDLSTTLLMERFYYLHLKKNISIPKALQQSQIWLRDVTAGELAERFANEEEIALEENRNLSGRASEYYSRFAEYNSDERPFAHPYYWAAFTFNGA